MIISSIKNKLYIPLHSTVELTRSKIGKVARFIFQSGCGLLRSIRDNPKITFAASAILIVGGIKEKTLLLLITGLVLGSLGAIFSGLKKGSAEQIKILSNRISKLQYQIDCEQAGYNDYLQGGGATQKKLLVFRKHLDNFVSKNTAEIENCQRKLVRIKALCNW